MSDPFEIFQKLSEILKDPDYKPKLLELLNERIVYEKAKTRDLESQTLQRLEKLTHTRKPVKPFQTGYSSTTTV